MRPATVSYALIVACICAALAPALSHDESPVGGAQHVEPHWPSHFQGQMLTELPLSAREGAFLAGFPGAVARFTDGERDIVMRWVTQPTRRLHPAEDCYRGLGYAVTASRIVTDDSGTRWRCFDATRKQDGREVCEQLQDLEGGRWTDVSAWYWAALLERSRGPWLVTTASVVSGAGGGGSFGPLALGVLLILFAARRSRRQQLRVA